MSERTESEWRSLYLSYKRRWEHSKRDGVAFVPTSYEREAHRRHGAAYAATPKGRAALRLGQANYRHSGHGKAKRVEFNRSEARKAIAARYVRTEKGRMSSRRAKAKWCRYAAPEHVDIWSLCVAQGNRCAICATAFSAITAPCLDHCHESGRVRGALCEKCNLGLGLFGDSPERLVSAANYLTALAPQVVKASA